MMDTAGVILDNKRIRKVKHVTSTYSKNVAYHSVFHVGLRGELEGQVELDPSELNPHHVVK